MDGGHEAELFCDYIWDITAFPIPAFYLNISVVGRYLVFIHDIPRHQSWKSSIS